MEKLLKSFVSLLNPIVLLGGVFKMAELQSITSFQEIELVMNWHSSKILYTDRNARLLFVTQQFSKLHNISHASVYKHLTRLVD